MAPKKAIYGVEIARLVLGYLQSTDRNLFKSFLDSSHFLIDIRDSYEDGDELDLNYRDKRLQEILEEYAHLFRMVQVKTNKLSTREKGELSGKTLPEKFDFLLSVQQTSQTVSEGCRCNTRKVSASTQTELNGQSLQSRRKSLQTATAFSQTEFTNPPSHDLNLTASSSPLPDLPTTPGTGLYMPPQYRRRNDSPTENSAPCSERLSCEPMEVENVNDQVDAKSDSKLTRSKSCSDLPGTVHGCEVLDARRRFFTPSKWRKEEPPDEVLMELLANRSIHEKLARSINHALAEVPDESPLDEIMANIIERTTADPTFDEIVNETLGSFDMSQFLRPKTRPDATTRIGENLPAHAAEALPASCTEEPMPVAEVLSATLVTMPGETAEMIPLPNISYQPVDQNIFISDVDDKGDIVFYSNPNRPTPGLFLPPPPPTVEKSRYRRIQPKPEKLRQPSQYNVIVCTPMMPPPDPLPKTTEITATTPRCQSASKRRGSKAPTPASRSSKRTTRSSQPPPNQTPLREEPPPVVLIPPTPGRVYTEDMPFLSTPQLDRHPLVPPEDNQPQTQEPEPEPEPIISTKDPTPKESTIPNVPEVTPHQAQPVRKRQTQSTPRRKSYIRTLEFETPQKDVDAKKCVTVPKRDPPISERTPEDAPKAVSNATTLGSKEISVNGQVTDKKETLRKKELILDSAKSPVVRKGGKLPRSAIKIGLSPKNKVKKFDAPIATRTPNKTLLSGFWDPLKTVIGDSNSKESTESTVDSSEIAILSNTNGQAPQQAAKTWDSMLRNCVGEAEVKADAPRTVKRRRKIRPKNSPKTPKASEPRVSKPRVTRSKAAKMSPSKKHAKSTTKRSTYAISHGSSSAFETSSSDEDAFIEVCVKNPDNSEITPAKIDAPVVPTEETPFTKLLRENVDCVDIDLSMIQTPVFPPTPSIAFYQEPVTPLHETRRTDYSSGSSYYKPDLTSPVSGKELALETVAEMEKSEEYLQDVSTVSGRNLVLTPDEKESTPNKQNKITDYFGKQSRLNSSPERRPAESSRLSSEGSLVTDQSTLVDQTRNLAGVEKDAVAQNLEDVSLKERDADATLTSKDKFAKNPEEKEKEPLDRSAKKVRNNSVSKINELVDEGKKIVAKRKMGGKHMGMFKLQMIAQCDVKLSQNIPISASPAKKVTESADVPQESLARPADSVQPEVTQQTQPEKSAPLSQLRDLWKKKTGAEKDAVGNGDAKTKPSVLDIAKKLQTGAKVQTSNVVEELEVKRRETLRKLKEGEAVKRSRKPLDRPTKRVRAEPKKVEVLPVPLVCSTPNKADTSRVSLNVSDADDTLKPESPIVARAEKTAPVAERVPPLTENVEEARKKEKGAGGRSPAKSETKNKPSPVGALPAFVDDGEFPELPLNTKKKFFAIKFLLELHEVRQYLENSTDKVQLVTSHRAIFRAMYKWLKNPREGEILSEKAQERMQHYLKQCSRVNKVLPAKTDRSGETSHDEGNSGSHSRRSSGKSPGRLKVPTLLPLKKRKNVPIAKTKDEPKSKSSTESVKDGGLVSKSKSTAKTKDGLVDAAAVSNAQSLLQQIDLDSFLSRVHGHDSS